MIDKKIIKYGLNQRLKNIDNFVDKNILIDPIDNLINQYKVLIECHNNNII